MSSWRGSSQIHAAGGALDMAMAGSHPSTAGKRPDETQVDVSFGLVAHRFVWNRLRPEGRARHGGQGFDLICLLGSVR